MDFFQTLGNIFRWIWETLVRLSEPLFKNFGKFISSFFETDVGWACFWVLVVFIILNLVQIKIAPKTKFDFTLFFLIYCGAIWGMSVTFIAQINRYTGLEVIGSTMVVLGSFRFFFDPVYKFFLSLLPKPKPQPTGK
jgi:hypothetical protein